MNRHRHRRGGFTICGQPASPNEGAGLRYVINRDRKNGGGVFKTCDESGSPKEVPSLRYVTNLDGRMKGQNQDRALDT